MNLPMFDQSKVKEQSFEGEAVRLSNEFRSKPAKTIIDSDGIRQDIPAKIGFDVETADFNIIKNWILTSKKQSDSQIAFINRILTVRFPTEYAGLRNEILTDYRDEYELIQSEGKNDIDFFGRTGFQNNVRLDGSLTEPGRELIIPRNGKISIRKK